MDLAISLGHNSSAALIEAGRVVFAYEEERFSKIKSDSHWPKNAIAEIFKHSPPSRKEKNTLYISHWYDDFDFYKTEIHERIQKHFDPVEVSKLMNDWAFKIVTLDENVTHHDAHAYSAIAFMISNAKQDTTPHNFETFENLVFVADGFGNRCEVFSAYSVQTTAKGIKKFERLSRINNYAQSLGLMYQYATSFCGMKENEDEYKFLGYESQIKDYLEEKDIIKLHELAMETSTKLNSDRRHLIRVGEFIDINALDQVKKDWHTTYAKVLDSFGIKEWKDDQARTIIGFFVQAIIEETMVGVVQTLQKNTGIPNICLAGGIFYNVKLNNAILKATKGHLCVVPLAGDQAGGIGLYYAKNQHHLTTDFDGFSNLCLGKRDFSDAGYTQTTDDKLHHVHIIDKKIPFVTKVVEELGKNTLVNVVHSQMEFGPRALCNTSTLALPTKENVELINTLNKRNTVMPMAPVMLRQHVDFFFDESQYKKVIGSDKFMIITYDYRTSLLYDKYSGVMHKYPLEEKYSGRPQVIEDNGLSIIQNILTQVWLRYGYACLINTSYNVHGVPIVRTFDDAIKSYEFQQNIIKDLKDVPSEKNILVVGNF